MKIGDEGNIKAKVVDCKEAIMNFAVAVLAETRECAKPIYEGDKEVDQWVRFSDVNDAINKCLTEHLTEVEDVEENAGKLQHH